MSSISSATSSVASKPVTGEVQAKVVKGALEQEAAVVDKLLSSVEPRSAAQQTGQSLNLKA